MSKESTVSTTPGLIDVANVSQDFHTSNEQNDYDVLSQAERSEFLRYPRNFFDRITGALPKDEEAASCLWAYRKGRPNNGSGNADMVAADGGAMLNEMKDIRESLRRFVMDEFLADMCQMARRSGMQIQSNAEVPATPSDFKKMLRQLINNPRNQKMVYDVVHKFHRDRFWIADAVDKWFEREKMMLEGEVRIQKKWEMCQVFCDRWWWFYRHCTSSKGTAREIIHAPHASKRGMVYSNNIQENLQENRNYQNSIYQNQITRL